MQVLELEPLKGKTLKLILLESEYSVDWWLEPPPKEMQNLFTSLKFISPEYVKLLEDLMAKNNPHFVVEEKGLRNLDEFLYDNALIDVFKERKIPYDMVDISQNALDYIDSVLEDKRNLLKKIQAEVLKVLGEKKDNLDNGYLQKLVQWGEYLQEECKAEEAEIKYKIREAWMMMGILELARSQETKKVTAILICDKDHFDGLTGLADELGIETEKINIKKEMKHSEEENSLNELIKKSSFEIMPIKIKKKKKEEKILYFFDTDDYASPFDINMGYDAGFDVVVPFSKVTAKNVTKLVQDAIFSRGPKAPTTFFIGGSNVQEGEKIAEAVIKALVPPFEAPVIIDPRGAHTTASAVVAKTQSIALEHGIENIAGKRVVVLGTGPVGRIAAIIAAKLNCQTTLVETWDQATEVSVKNLASNLTKAAGDGATEIIGKFAATESDRFEIIDAADIVWAVAAAGIQIVSKSMLSELSPNKIFVDINAVPPTGIEGLKPTHDDKEISPGIFGTGALALGSLKYQIENTILKEASNTKGKKIFDYNLAFEVAQKLLRKTEKVIVGSVS